MFCLQLLRTALHYAMGIERVETISNILIQAGALRVVKDLVRAVSNGWLGGGVLFDVKLLIFVMALMKSKIVSIIKNIHVFLYYGHFLK